MKTQVIKTRNIPPVEGKVHLVRVKPDLYILILMALGVTFMFAKTYMVIVGFIMILLALFAEFLMPDRLLCEFTPQYVVFFNRTDRSECTVIYWEDVVSWKYEWHGFADLLVISLVDGSTETQEMYSRHSCAKWMKMYAAGKEARVRSK